MSVDISSAIVLLKWNELPVDTDFSSINSFARALVGLNFSDYCDSYNYIFIFV